MTFRPFAEMLESRRLLAVAVSGGQGDLSTDPNLMVQSIAGARGGGTIVNGSMVPPVTVIAYSNRNTSTGLGDDVFVRAFIDGQTAPTETQVNLTTNDAQQSPDVAVNASGDRVVVWQSRNQDGSGWGIYARLYNATTAAATAAEIAVNSTTAGDQTAPTVAMDTSGNFVVAWVSAGAIVARKFDSSGAAVTGEVVVAQSSGQSYADPDIAMYSDGRFAVAFTRGATSGDVTRDVMLRTFAADATATSAAQVVNTATVGEQYLPAIAVAGANVVVAWADASGGDASIFFRVYDAAGSAQTDATQASQDSDGTRSSPHVVGDANGNFTVGWSRNESGAFYNTIDLRSYDSNFAATSNEFAFGDGSSQRTLFDLVQTGTGTFADVSTVGEFLGYGVGVTVGFVNYLPLDGTGGADKIVGYDLNATTYRASVNGVAKNYSRSAYAYVRSDLGDGNDSIDLTGSLMASAVIGGAGDDTIRTGNGRDSVDGGDGADYIDVGGDNDYVSAGSGDDTIFGGGGNDTLTGGGGRNRVYGGDGNDRLNGSGGRDFLYGEAGDDRLYGNGGNDYLDGGGNVDRIYAGDGDDMLIGGSGVDRLYGEAGNDSFIGGRGNDYLFGGDGTDRDLVPDAGDILDSIEIHG